MGGPPRGYWHTGDLLWLVYRNEVYHPYENIRLWENGGGQSLGFATYDEPALVDLQLHPLLR